MRELIKRILGRRQVEYAGNFPSWDDAVKASGTYAERDIFERVKEARMKVLRGEAAYERDSVTFSNVQYFWPVLASLLFAASKNGGKLNVLDFGGSLGTSYFQNRAFLEHLDVTWNIVEQKQFVVFGKEKLADETLRFYESFEQAIASRPNVFLISSVLQYLPDPYQLIGKVKNAGFSHLIFDRTTFAKDGDRITVQNVPKHIYATNFPAWLFSEKKMVAFLGDKYRLVSDFPSIGNPITLDNGIGANKGFLFERK